MKKSAGAYLTVYLSLTLGVLLTLSLALIEAVRLNTLQLELNCISDIGMDAVMAEYHRELFQRFNLLAVDSSYGTKSSGTDKVRGRLEYYLAQNMAGYEEEKLGTIAQGFYRDFLQMNLLDVSLLEISSLTDDNGTVFRRQAVWALQDDLGVVSVGDMVGWLQTVEKYQLDTRDIEAEKREVDEKLASYQGKELQSENGTEILNFEDPTVMVEKRKKIGILKQTMGDKELSGKKLNQSILIRQRIKDGRAIKGNIVIEERNRTLELAERIAFTEYLMRYMGCVLEEKKNSALAYELEYIIAGKDADADNLRAVLQRLLALREAANAAYLFGDKEKSGEAEFAALAVSAVLLVPELKDLFKTAIILGWSYAESVYDLKVLLSGGKIPLMKDKTSWHYGLSGILEGAWEELWNGESAAFENGLAYQDYLRILLLVMQEDEMTLRAMNLVEADIRQTSGNKAFRLDACFVTIGSRIRVESRYGYQMSCVMKKEY